MRGTGGSTIQTLVWAVGRKLRLHPCASQVVDCVRGLSLRLGVDVELYIPVEILSGWHFDSRIRLLLWDLGLTLRLKARKSGS